MSKDLYAIPILFAIIIGQFFLLDLVKMRNDPGGYLIRYGMKYFDCYASEADIITGLGLSVEGEKKMRECIVQSYESGASQKDAGTNKGKRIRAAYIYALGSLQDMESFIE